VAAIAHEVERQDRHAHHHGREHPPARSASSPEGSSTRTDLLRRAGTLCHRSRAPDSVTAGNHRAGNHRAGEGPPGLQSISARGQSVVAALRMTTVSRSFKTLAARATQGASTRTDLPSPS
jgi:hypothetical protein